MDCLFAAQGAADPLSELDLALEYGKKVCSVQCHGKEGEVIYNDWKGGECVSMRTCVAMAG